MKNAVIAGDLLELVRPLQQRGIAIIPLLHGKNSPLRFSRYCRDWRVLPRPSEEPQRALKVLLEVAGECAETPILYYVDDSMLALIQNNRTTLQRHYHFLMPDDATVRACGDKAAFVNFAHVHRLPVPRQISSKDIDEGRDFHELGFPVVIKPGTRVGWYESEAIRATGGKPSKMVLAKDKAEADTLIALTRKLTNDFVVQEFIPGGENQIYSYHAFANESFEALGWYVGRKVRSYPSLGGQSTCLELVHDEQIAQLGREILQRLRICGPVKMDFKKDPRTGTIYLLEINLRFNLWHHLGAACGVNLPLVAYLYFRGETVRQPSHYRTDLTWMDFKLDLQAVLGEYLPSGDCTGREYIQSLMMPKVHHVFAWNDPLPALFSYRQALWRQLGRLFGRLLRRRAP